MSESEDLFEYYEALIGKAHNLYVTTNYSQIRKAAKLFLMQLLIACVGDDSLTGEQRLNLTEKIITSFTNKNNKGDN